VVLSLGRTATARLSSPQCRNSPRSSRPTRQSVVARGDFEQVVAELGLDRALHFVERGREHDFVELTNHLAAAEAAQFAATTAGRALGMLHGELDEVFAVGDALFQFE